MKSMTGFGRAVCDCEEFSLTVDVSSVNKKGLELNVSLPRDWQAMERLVAQKIKKSFARGKVSVSCRVDFKKATTAFLSDEASLEAAVKHLESVCDKLGASFKLSADIILKIDEKLSDAPSSADWEESWDKVESAVDQAIEKADQMRESEGAALKADIAMRLQAIYEFVAQAEKESQGTVEKYRQQLLSKLSAAGLEIDLSDERLLKEVCLFADKCDICEEITRLNSHISQFISTMDEVDAVGRKMDFICQEMGREINTVASKANNLELTKLAIELKNELERIREQTQNIE